MPRHLTEEQAMACRSNPLAAFLAKRLPVLFWFSITINILSLASVLLAVMSTLSMFPGAATPGVYHTVAATTSTLTVVVGIVLALELYWVHKYSISPEHFKHHGVDLSDFSSDEGGGGCEDLLRAVSNLTGKFRDQAALDQAKTRGERSATVRDVAQASYVLHRAVADILEATIRGLEDLSLQPSAGPNAGFRRLESTRSTLIKLGKLSHRGVQHLRQGSRAACKAGKPNDNDPRGFRAKDRQPDGA